MAAAYNEHMSNLFAFLSANHIVQAVIIGSTLAFLTAVVVINAKIKRIQTTINGWSSSLICGKPGNDILTRAATSKYLPGVNVAEEAMYWTTIVDNMHRKLNSQHDYRLHFPAGQKPPNSAFWSLTITDSQGYMVKNEFKRCSVGDRSGLVPNNDGSIDVYIQRTIPEMHETNWLPAPTGDFKLMLRVYLPGQAILDGIYQVPPVEKVR